MKIILAVNNPVSWDEMTYEKFKLQNNPFNINYILDFIHTWDKIAAISYFEFRNEIHKIAFKNWMQLPNIKITYNSKEVLASIDVDDILLICDDDDWYSPLS